jgi:hypothetical protein
MGRSASVSENTVDLEQLGLSAPLNQVQMAPTLEQQGHDSVIPRQVHRLGSFLWHGCLRDIMNAQDKIVNGYTVTLALMVRAPIPAFTRFRR